MKKKLFLYIHIPFCSVKCGYCHFYSIDKNINLYFEAYYNALIKQINYYKTNFDLDSFSLKSIYFGGGTPSLFPVKYIFKLIDYIFNVFYIDNNIEITLEANPETLTLNKVLEYKKIGIGRISIGIQSFVERFRKILSRNSSNSAIFSSIYLVRKYFENFNIDLIYSIPFQNTEDLEKEFLFIDKIEPPHISYYGLIYDNDTKFYKRYQRFFEDLQYEQKFSDLYLNICSFLESRGYAHYEISNFAKSGFESKHNIAYWEFYEYIGLGASASSFFYNKRYKNQVNIINFLKYPLLFIEDIHNNEDFLLEKIFLSLRYYKGLDLDKFKIKDFVLENIPKQYFQIDGRFLKLTNKGYLVSDEISIMIFNYIIDNNNKDYFLDIITHPL